MEAHSLRVGCGELPHSAGRKSVSEGPYDCIDIGGAVGIAGRLGGVECTRRWRRGRGADLVCEEWSTAVVKREGEELASTGVAGGQMGGQCCRSKKLNE